MADASAEVGVRRAPMTLVHVVLEAQRIENLEGVPLADPIVAAPLFSRGPGPGDPGGPGAVPAR